MLDHRPAFALGTWTRVAGAAVVAIFAAACADAPPTGRNRVIFDGDDGAPAVDVPRPTLEEGLFPMASPRMREGAVPEAFSRELPATVDAFRRDWGTYPSVHVRRGLCKGDGTTLARFERAVAAASATATPEEIRETYGELLAWCDEPALCRWAADAVGRGGPVGQVAWAGLERCGPEVEALFERPDAPPDRTIEYWSSRQWLPGFTPRFVPAVAEAARKVALAGEAMSARRAAMFLTDVPDPRSAVALLALHDALPAGDVRDNVDAALGRLQDPRAKELFAALCARPDQREPMCRPDGGVLIAGLDSADDEEQEEPPTPASPTREVARAERLRALGVLWRGPLDPADADEGDALMAQGPVHCFDSETDQFPNEHDALLYQLAELAGPPLSEAVFEEIVPPFEVEPGIWLYDGIRHKKLPDGVSQGMPYRLRAYLDGHVWEVDAQNFGDWYDLEQTLALLNAVAAARGADTRVASLPTNDQTACVIAAPKAVLRAAVDAKELALAGAGEARDQGKGFEEKAFRHVTGQD